MLLYTSAFQHAQAAATLPLLRHKLRLPAVLTMSVLRCVPAGDKALFEEWNAEMAGMAGRIARVRGELQSSLEAKMPDKDWSFITRQIGMFSFTGLSPAQVGGAG